MQKWQGARFPFRHFPAQNLSDIINFDFKTVYTFFFVSCNMLRFPTLSHVKEDQFQSFGVTGVKV